VSQQEPREERDYFTVLPDDLRPAGNGKDCFYCDKPLGQQHKKDCVITWGSSWYIVTLCNNETGAVRRYREDSVWNDTGEFMWFEGNFACDCNRHMMFQRARGEEPEWHTPCGHTRYTVLNIELPDGTLVYP
jgi:hypothetical protein